MELFGYKIARKDEPKNEPDLRSIVPPDDDGAVDTYRTSGFYSSFMDIDNSARSEADLIQKYRDCAALSDVDRAVADIVDTGIANLEDEDPVTLNLDKITTISDKTKKAIHQEFRYICNLMSARRKLHGHFRRWYIDGRLVFHTLVDKDNPKDGIKELRSIDPRKIRKIRVIEKIKDKKTGVDLIGKIEEFYVFNEKNSKTTTVAPAGQDSKGIQGIKINKDAITFVPSGLVDPDSNMILGYLQPALRPSNQLRLMENSAVIYRLARAPERRIFYIDTGKMNAKKSEAHVKGIMNNYRNKLSFDPTTGELKDDKRFMSVIEDYWLPRQEGTKGTEIDTLPGGENLGKIDDLMYFQRKLYESLNVPVTRLSSESGGGLNFGKAAEISRDELKYQKFIRRLQLQFSFLFEDLLKKQCLLKNIITDEDWKGFREEIRFVFAQDAFYEETKNMEILKAKAETLAMLAPYVEILFPSEYLQKEVMNFTDEQIKAFNKTRNPASIAYDAELEKEMKQKEKDKEQ